MREKFELASKLEIPESEKSELLQELLHYQTRRYAPQNQELIDTSCNSH